MIPARVRPRSYWASFGLGSGSTRVELRVGLRSGWSLIVVNQCVFNETSDVSLGSRCSLENAAPSKCHAGQKGKAFLGSKAKKRLFFARSRFFSCYCIRDPFHMKSTDRGLEVGNHWPFCYCQSQDDLMRELMTCLERAFYMFRAKSFYSLAKSLRFFGGVMARRTVGKSIESSTLVTVELMRVVKTLLSIEFSGGRQAERLSAWWKFQARPLWKVF